MMLLGAVGAAYSIYCQMTAAHHANMMVNHPPPPPQEHHGKHGRHHPPPPTPEEIEANTPEFVSRNEFDLYETIKTLSMISFFFFCKIIALGKCGKKMVWKNKSQATHRLYRKSCLGLVLIVISGIVCAHYGHHIMSIMKKVKKQHEAERAEEMPILDGQVFDIEKFGGRNLEQTPAETQLSMIFNKNVQNACSGIRNGRTCDANAACAWCQAGTQHDECFPIEEARMLPTSVFFCAKVHAEEPEEPPKVEVSQQLKDDRATCNALTRSGRNACNANSICAWCFAGTQPNECFTVEDAHLLPAAVFDCDKVNEFEIMKDEAQKAMKEAEKMINRIPAIFRDDEKICGPLDESNCKEDKRCSWCEAGAVPPACHSVENARGLPPAVFECTNIGQEEPAMFRRFDRVFEKMSAMFNDHRPRHHRGEPEEPEDDEEEFSGRHHGKHGRHGKHGKHHGRPFVQADQDEDDEDMEIIAGMPVRGDHAKGFRHHGDHQEGHHGRHGKHGHGKHHHGCKGGKFFNLLAIAFVGTHFLFIRGLRHHQEVYEILTGKLDPKDVRKGRKWGRCGRKAVQPVVHQPQQVFVSQPVVEYSAVNDTEISEERDKDMGQQQIVFAPAPVSSLVDTQRHSMI